MKIHDEKAKRRHAWCEKRLKYMASCNDDVLGEKTDEDYELEYIDIGNVSSMGQITTIESMPFGNAPSRARRKVKEGDVIVSTVRTYLRAIAKIENPTENTVVSTGFAVVRPRQNVVDGGFLGFALRSSGFIDEVVARSTGVSYPAITASELMKIPLQFPPLSEQRTIADFLDRETDKIDRLIAEKEKLLVLLEEKRKATISQAVTKGLNPDVKMRDSGIPWLGMIPEHWGVKRLKNLVNLKCGSGITSSNIHVEGRHPVFGGNGVRGFTTDYTHEGEFILIGRQGALCGNINYASGQFWASEHAVVATPVAKFNTLWLGELLRSMDLNQYSLSAAQPGLAVDRIQVLSLPVPPDNDQSEIAGFLELINVRTDEIVENTKNVVYLLHERRAALISAAVTGQIDVRETVGEVPNTGTSHLTSSGKGVS